MSSEARRRSGCWTCKEKHVQCTEEKPICKRCVRLNLPCSFGMRLLWKDDAAQRGICLGREGSWQKRPKEKKKQRTHDFQPINLDAYVGRWIFLNATYNDFGNEFVAVHAETEENVSEDEGDLEVVASNVSMVPWEPLLNGSHLAMAEGEWLNIPSSLSTPLYDFSSIEGNLFDYFVAYICPKCSLSSSQNPYLTLLTPMSFLFPPLKNALLATAANELCLLNDKRFEREAWHHKAMALKGVQQAINDGQMGWGVIATILMLCFYDIADGCDGSWVTHLRGGLNLLNQQSTQISGSESVLHQFLRMYFVAHAIMSQTANEEDFGEDTHQWLDGDNLDEIDTLMGCSRGLMSLIQEISALASKVSKITVCRQLTDIEVSTFTLARDTIERSLHTLNQILPPSPINPAITLRIAETKRLSALLYLRERLGTRLIPSNTNSTHTTVSGEVTSYKLELIRTIIRYISTLPETPTLLWPLFVLGNADLDEENRRFVLERLRNIQRVRNLGSVRQARIVVEERWKVGDLNLGDRGARGWDSKRVGKRRRGGRLVSLA